MQQRRPNNNIFINAPGGNAGPQGGGGGGGVSGIHPASNPTLASKRFNQGIGQWNEGYKSSDPYEKLAKFKVALDYYEEAYRLDPNHELAYGYASDMINKWIPMAERAISSNRPRP